MPEIQDPIRISGMGNFPSRTPFRKHTFVGGNVYMLNLLKDNIESLGITAEPQHFDSTISRTEYSLKEQSVLLNISSRYLEDQLEVKLFIKNLTGHKIPTGIPLRRMWVHLKIEEPGGNVIFESGEWDNSGRLLDYNSDYEPHYDIINSEDQVQVYEGVFTDVNQKVTYTLLKAGQYVKDNRIPPQGFSTTHISYDSIKIYGDAAYDDNFNRYGLYQGTGGDSVTYMIPVVPNTSYKITAELCYQSVKPELVDYLRDINEEDIIKFVKMYDKLPNIPVIMKSVLSDFITSVDNIQEYPKELKLRQNYPNPFNPVTQFDFEIPNSSFVSLKIFDLLGNEIATLLNENMEAGYYSTKWDATHFPSGIYFYKIQAGRYIQTKKMLLLK
jgi:hypothetical protein